MCGIVGYVGKAQAKPFLINGLKQLEYRGYDSAGIAVIDGGKLNVVKRAGKVAVLASSVSGVNGTCGIGHTRWATHGKPCQRNAHPQVCGKFAIVHNGIVENYIPLKNELVASGASFSSDTDTEVIVQLINSIYDGKDFLGAVKKALDKVSGSYALAVLCSDFPDEVIVARKFSPLIVGFGEGENYVASDIPALAKYTRKVCVMSDGEYAVIKADSIAFYNSELNRIEKSASVVDIEANSLDVNGYDSYMRKEIDEIPVAIRNTVINYLYNNATDKALFENIIRESDRIIIVACGTAYHSGVVAKYVIERFARMPVECELASEFRYKDPIIDNKTMVIAISQSGETADTIAAVKLAKERGAKIVVVSNVKTSSITHDADVVFFTLAGVEIGVAATKSYNSQLALLYLMAFTVSEIKNNFASGKYIEELKNIPEKAEEILKADVDYKSLAERFKDKSSVFFIGRNLDYAISLEGSLKLKEISYIHSEGYAAGELKHGTLALIDDSALVIAIMTQSAVAEKTENAVNQVASRGATVGVVTMDKKFNDKTYCKENCVDFIFMIPEVDDVFSPILSVIPLQLFAYHMARAKNCDPDKPRNLAKSVTVE